MKNPTDDWTDMNNPAYLALFNSHEKACERITELKAQLAAAQARLVEEEELNVRNAASASLRVAALEAEIMGMRAEITTWREACFKARESGVRALMEIEKLENER